jgi:hypothetical protein
MNVCDHRLSYAIQGLNPKIRNLQSKILFDPLGMKVVIGYDIKSWPQIVLQRKLKMVDKGTSYEMASLPLAGHSAFLLFKGPR